MRGEGARQKKEIKRGKKEIGKRRTKNKRERELTVRGKKK